MLKPGIVSITFRGTSPEEILERAAAAGLEGIEWGGDVHVPHGDLSAARRVGELTRGSDLSVVAYGSYYRFGEIFGREGPDFGAVLDSAEALGAPVVRVWAGSKGSDGTDENERRRLVEAARRHGENAGARGMVVAFEYHRNTLTDTNDSAATLLEEIAHPNVRTLWQPPNGASLEYCLDGLRRVLPRLEHLHCFHWGASGSDDKRPLHEGKELWLSYLEEVAGATPHSQDRWVLLEFVPGGSWESLYRDARTLRDWIRVTDSG